MLEYQLKHGAVREKASWLKQLRDQGKLKKVPGQDDAEGTKDEPILLSTSMEIWGAFIDLSGQRHYGQHGPQPIAFSEVVAWTKLHRTNVYDVPFLTSLIVKLDRMFVTHSYAQIKRERDKGAQKSASRRGM